MEIEKHFFQLDTLWLVDFKQQQKTEPNAKMLYSNLPGCLRYVIVIFLFL